MELERDTPSTYPSFGFVLPHRSLRTYLAKSLGMSEKKLIGYLLGRKPLTIVEASFIERFTDGELKAKDLLDAQRTAISNQWIKFKS